MLFYYHNYMYSEITYENIDIFFKFIRLYK